MQKTRGITITAYLDNSNIHCYLRSTADGRITIDISTTEMTADMLDAILGHIASRLSILLNTIGIVVTDEQLAFELNAAKHVEATMLLTELEKSDDNTNR